MIHDDVAVSVEVVVMADAGVTMLADDDTCVMLTVMGDGWCWRCRWWRRKWGCQRC